MRLFDISHHDRLKIPGDRTGNSFAPFDPVIPYEVDVNAACRLNVQLPAFIGKHQGTFSSSGVFDHYVENEISGGANVVGNEDDVEQLFEERKFQFNNIRRGQVRRSRRYLVCVPLSVNE